MQRPRLLLLTSRFPFGKGEEFLTTEIDYLAKKFAITIAPTVQDIDLTIRHVVPDDVVVRTDIVTESFSNFVPPTRHVLLPASWLSALPKLCRKIRCRPTFIRQFFGFVFQARAIGNALLGALGSEKIDLVYSYWLSPAALAGALLKQHGLVRGAVARAHGVDLYHDRSPSGYLPAQELTIASLDKIFCISQHGADYLREKHPSYQKKIALSRLGVRAAPKKNPSSSGHRLHLVSCSHLSPVKRIPLLIEALSGSDIPIVWTHLGGGKQEKLVRELARRLPPHIQWRITGAITNEEVLRFYQDQPVDLFVNVSASEGLPVSIMEAFSYGIPVAATNVGGTGELVRAGENGFLWPVSITPQEIAQSLANFFEMPVSQKQAMRRAAWEVWRQKANASVQYPAFVEQIAAIL